MLACYSPPASLQSWTVQDYIDTFEPLLLEECGSLLVRGSEEGIASAAEHAISSELSQVS